MAEEDNIPTEVSDNIDRSLGEEPRKKKKVQPTYQVLGDSKIPVSSVTGDTWKSRFRMGKKATENVSKAWDEAMRYYDNDQTRHRADTDEDVSGNLVGNQRLNDNITQTENIIYSNTTTMVPALYAQNPRVEFTTRDESKKKLATATERLINDLLNRKSKPGVAIKNKIKRSVVTTLLTNRSWLVVNWIQKEESSEQALLELQNLAQQLVKAKKPKDILEIEGKIMALEDTISALNPAGPDVKFKLPSEVITDPASIELPGHDAQWMMIIDYLPTSFIKAKYATKKGADFKSLFKPSHIMKLGEKDGEAHTGQEVDFSLFDENDLAKDFGFEDDNSFEKAQMTKVVFVWDKVTRRVLMFNHKDWTWPIWVWDDPLRLDTFFPAFPLTFFEGPSGPNTKGEVSYYLDQADAINEITDEKRRARRWARRNIFFDSNRINADDAAAVLNGDDGTAKGVDVPEGMKITDLIFSMPTPSMQFAELFDKEEEYKAVDRISSVSEVLRGAQFKTNTTNRAVDANVSSSNMRLDEKSDAIEDHVGCVGWAIAQLCLMNWDKETVAGIIGQEAAVDWVNLSPEEIRSSFTPRVVSGTSKKPTSKAKKEEALELGQVLGQFVQASPQVVIVMLEVLKEAFDEVTITEEQWQSIIDSLSQPAAPGGSPQDAASEPGPNSPGVTEGGDEQAAAQAAELKATLDTLTPEQKQQVAALIQEGVQPIQAVQQVTATQTQQ